MLIFGCKYSFFKNDILIFWQSSRKYFKRSVKQKLLVIYLKYYFPNPLINVSVPIWQWKIMQLSCLLTKTWVNFIKAVKTTKHCSCVYLHSQLRIGLAPTQLVKDVSKNVYNTVSNTKNFNKNHFKIVFKMRTPRWYISPNNQIKSQGDKNK